MIALPFDVRELSGTGGQVRVQASFDGELYRGSLEPMGDGRHALGVTKTIREAIGKDVGDDLHVTFRSDTEERTVVLPPELVAAFAGSPAAKRRYEGLSYTHRREYAEWVAEAKREKTRKRRAARAIERLCVDHGGRR